ncbi:MAG TPA: hypothetical protein VIM84_00170 [Gemmatimonadales bacterium]
MFLTIRRYSPKNGAINRASLELLRRQVQEQFLPVIQQVPGFRAFHVVSIANAELLTITICDSREGIAESTRCAAEYTMRNPLMYELGRPEITEGEVLTSLLAAGGPAEGGDAAATALALWYAESRGMLLTASQR